MLLLFLDNDILLKIGSLGFLENLKNLFSNDTSSIFILPTAKPYILNNKNLRNKYSEHTLNEIVTILKNYKIILDEFIDDKRYRSLTSIDKIDSGERVLFSLNPPNTDFLILTGDKNSIIQLAKQGSINEITSTLTRRIVCLEHILLKLLDLHGIDIIGKRIIERDFGGDKTLNLVFNQPNLTIEKVRGGLLSYYNDLYSQSNKFLLPL